MKIISYKEQYRDDVLNLHKLALGTAYMAKYDDDLIDIKNIYLKTGAYLLGLIDDKLVAMGAFRILDDNTALIKRMRVHPDFQRKGHGQVIYNELEKIAAKKGIKHLELDTSSSLVAAQKFYKKNGYLEVQRKKSADTDADLIFYKKDI